MFSSICVVVVVIVVAFHFQRYRTNIRIHQTQYKLLLQNISSNREMERKKKHFFFIVQNVIKEKYFVMWTYCDWMMTKCLRNFTIVNSMMKNWQQTYNTQGMIECVCGELSVRLASFIVYDQIHHISFCLFVCLFANNPMQNFKYSHWNSTIEFDYVLHFYSYVEIIICFGIISIEWQNSVYRCVFW